MLLAGLVPLPALAFGHSATTPLPDGLYKSWKQTDERWRDLVLGKDPWTDGAGNRHEEETMGHAGCLITSMAILSRAYGLTLKDGTEITPLTLGKAMYDNGSCKYLNERGGANYAVAFDELIPGVHFADFEQPGNPTNRITQLLSDASKEYVIVAGVNNGGHYVAVDYVENGKVHICDPGYDRALLSEYNVYCLLVYTMDEQYVDPGASPHPASSLWVVVEEVGVRVRTEPRIDADVLFSYAKGTQMEVLETVEADGYLWGRHADGWSALRMLDGGEVYCVPVQTGEQFTVTYHTNGGTGGPAPQQKAVGIDLRLSSDVPSKNGYRFLGWSTDPSAVSADYVPGGWYRTDASAALYAVWMPESDLFGFGIDVSAYQGDVDWEKVASDGIRFVILRAGTSNGKDERFEENYRGAKAAGLHIGSYFYSYALTESEVQKDAEDFRSYLEGKAFDMPVYLDLETEEQGALSAEKLVQLALRFQTAMEDAGLFCGVYSSSSWFDTKLNGDRLGGRPYLWVAQWTASGTLSQNMSRKYGLYQYSDTGRVDGISTVVDLDVCYIDYPTLIANTVTNRPADPVPTPGSGLNVREGIVYGGKPGMTAQEWNALFVGSVKLRRADGTLMEPEETVCTGCEVEYEGRSFPIGVRGDVNGDGKTDSMDYLLIKRNVLGSFALEGGAYYAGCLFGEEINSTDYMLLKRHVLGTFDLYG